jgi:hypothetical protein
MLLSERHIEKIDRTIKKVRDLAENTSDQNRQYRMQCAVGQLVFCKVQAKFGSYFATPEDFKFILAETNVRYLDLYKFNCIECGDTLEAFNITMVQLEEHFTKIADVFKRLRKRFELPEEPQE